MTMIKTVTRDKHECRGTGGNNDDDGEDSSVAFEDSGGETMIPADIRAMSNEELMKSIEKLKKGGDKRESSITPLLPLSSGESSQLRSPLWKRVIFFWR